MKPILLVVCLLSLVPLNSASAKGAKGPKAVKVHAAGAKITAISANLISVEIAKDTHTYAISAQTQVHLNGMKASVKDLRKGMRADVTASQLDPRAAMMIEASDGN
jgi:hypothetical protein